MPPEHFHSLRVECVHCCKLSGAEFDHTFWWYNIAARARRRVCGDYPLSMSIPRLLGSMLRPSSSRFRAFIRVRCVSVRAAESAPDACRRVSAHRSMSYLTLVCAFWVYKVANRSKMSLSFAPPRNPISAAGTPNLASFSPSFFYGRAQEAAPTPTGSREASQATSVHRFRATSS